MSDDGQGQPTAEMQLCPRCQQMVPAISMTSVVDGGWMCRTCRTQRQPPRPPLEQVVPLHGWQAVAKWTIGDGTVTVVLRALIYLVFFTGIDPHTSVVQFHLHAALSGVLLGDLLAWAVFALVDVMHLDRGVPFQFLAFGIANSAVFQITGTLPIPKDPYAMGIAFPFFLLTCAGKTVWWQVKRTMQ